MLLGNGLCNTEYSNLEVCCFDFQDCYTRNNNSIDSTDTIQINNDIIEMALSPCSNSNCNLKQSRISDGYCNSEFLEANEDCCFDGLDCTVDYVDQNMTINVKDCLLSCRRVIGFDYSLAIYDGYCDEQLYNPDCCMDGLDCEHLKSHWNNVCSQNCTFLVKVIGFMS